jgi:hypothetical protein
LTAVYASTNFAVGGDYTNPLTIQFSQPISAFSILVTNEVEGTYTVADNLGGQQSASLNLNEGHVFNLSDTGITSVTILGDVSAGFFDFSIDNVTFRSQVPETGSTSILMALAILGLFAVKRFIRAAA